MTRSPTDKEDIIDEVLGTFRANIFFRNFDVRNSGDRTLIYLTLYVQQCLVKLEKIEDKASGRIINIDSFSCSFRFNCSSLSYFLLCSLSATRELRALAVKPFSCPGEPAWPLGSLFAAPASRTEADAFKAYFKQAREEIGNRLIALVFEDGTKSKWWQVRSCLRHVTSNPYVPLPITGFFETKVHEQRAQGLIYMVFLIMHIVV
jgi:actin related protein 2/3 complex subunit 3